MLYDITKRQENLKDQERRAKSIAAALTSVHTVLLSLTLEDECWSKFMATLPMTGNYSTFIHTSRYRYPVQNLYAAMNSKLSKLELTVSYMGSTVLDLRILGQHCPNLYELILFGGEEFGNRWRDFDLVRNFEGLVRNFGGLPASLRALTIFCIDLRLEEWIEVRR